ncbi:hypothetical protein ACOME3_006608 [Neoechinorhynchus agilis]
MVSKTVVQETPKAAADNGRSILNENIICQRISEKVLEEVSHLITMLFNNMQNQLAEHIHKLLTLIQPATPNQFASVSDCNPNNGVKMVSAQPKAHLHRMMPSGTSPAPLNLHCLQWNSGGAAALNRLNFFNHINRDFICLHEVKKAAFEFNNLLPTSVLMKYDVFPSPLNPHSSGLLSLFKKELCVSLVQSYLNENLLFALFEMKGKAGGNF